MITDPHVFAEDHLPRELQHREAQVATLGRAWDRTRHGQTGDEVIISGPSGVGKTALARHTLDRLSRRAPVASAYVQSLGKSPAGVLRSILEDLRTPDPPTNEATERLQRRLVEATTRPVIVVLDEADDLPGSPVLDRLAKIPQLATVVVTHDATKWLAELEHETERYREAAHVELSRYGVSELADILEARADAGLPPDVVTREQLESIADEVAGVARQGIQALRAAAELAEERDHSTILEEDVDDSFERARHRIREANLSSLPFHHQVLYALVFEAGQIGGSELHDRYDVVAERVYRGATRTPIGRRARRNKLRKLREYDLVECAGEGRDRRYSVVDERVTPAVQISARHRSGQ